MQDYFRNVPGAAERVDALEAQLDTASDTIKGSEPKFSQYQLPGGENYKEMLLTMPWKDSGIDVRAVEGKYRLWDNATQSLVKTPDGKLIPGFDSGSKPAVLPPIMVRVGCNFVAITTTSPTSSPMLGSMTALMPLARRRCS